MNPFEKPNGRLLLLAPNKIDPSPWQARNSGSRSLDRMTSKLWVRVGESIAFMCAPPIARGRTRAGCRRRRSRV